MFSVVNEASMDEFFDNIKEKVISAFKKILEAIKKAVTFITEKMIGFIDKLLSKLSTMITSESTLLEDAQKEREYREADDKLVIYDIDFNKIYDILNKFYHFINDDMRKMKHEIDDFANKVKNDQTISKKDLNSFDKKYVDTDYDKFNKDILDSQFKLTNHLNDKESIVEPKFYDMDKIDIRNIKQMVSDIRRKNANILKIFKDLDKTCNLAIKNCDSSLSDFARRYKRGDSYNPNRALEIAYYNLSKQYQRCASDMSWFTKQLVSYIRYNSHSIIKIANYTKANIGSLNSGE